MSKSSDLEKTRRHDQKMKDKGLVKIHPWVPSERKEAVLAYCKQVRQDYFKGEGNE